MERRQFIIGALGAMAAPLALSRSAVAGDKIYIGDMHFHSFFQRPDGAQMRPLARAMARGNVTLLGWSLVGDLEWLKSTRAGLKQKGTPRKGEAVTYFKKELKLIKAHLADQGLQIALTGDDVDAALRGDPRVVLSVEGATFADDDAAEIAAAHKAGIRHIQLVHYIRTPMGDFQTEAPVHNGLSEHGKTIVRECNRLGILIDLAHCTREAVEQALEISKAPMVWSHSSVTDKRLPNWKLPVWQARQLNIETAKAIAAKGGVIGLWALKSDVGPTPESYAKRLAQMADWIGEDHVAIGSDFNALANPALAHYGDFKRVVSHWNENGMSPARIRKLAIENYARVLKQAMAPVGAG